MCLQQQCNIFNSQAFYDIRFSLRFFLKVKRYENCSNVLRRLCGDNLNYKLIKSDDYPFSIFFLAHFLSFFSALLLSLPFALYILSGCHKKLAVYYGQSLEIGPWSMMGIVDHFTAIFVPKLTMLFFNLLRQEVVDIQNRPLCGKVYPNLLSAYQEYLVTFKLMTSQVVQRAQPFMTY